MMDCLTIITQTLIQSVTLQEAIITEVKEHLKEVTDRELKARETLKIEVQKRNIVEKELADAMRAVEEGAEMVQRDQDVSNNI